MYNHDDLIATEKGAALEVVVRFENRPGGASRHEGTVSGSVGLTGVYEGESVHFDGWLQLLGILETLIENRS